MNRPPAGANTRLVRGATSRSQKAAGGWNLAPGRIGRSPVSTETLTFWNFLSSWEQIGGWCAFKLPGIPGAFFATVAKREFSGSTAASPLFIQGEIRQQIEQ
jgi:hypothetical protein